MNVGPLHLRSSPPISGNCLKLYIVDCVVRARIYRSSISFDLRRFLKLLRRRSTSDRWFPTLLIGLRHVAGIPANLPVFPRFLSIYDASLEYPRLLDSRVFIDLRLIAEFPRLRSPASFTLELY